MNTGWHKLRCFKSHFCAGFDKLKILVAVLIFGSQALAAEGHLLRLELVGGLDVQNNITEEGGVTGASVALVYPVSAPEKEVQVQFGVVTSYIHDFAPINLDLLKFGFSLRILLDMIPGVRPYFIHDITSRVIWIENQPGFGSSFGVRLGLGAGFALGPRDKQGQVPEIMCDVSYDFYHLGNFESPELHQRTVQAAVSVSLPF